MSKKLMFNWKMNPNSLVEAKPILDVLKIGLNEECVVYPPSLFVKDIVETIKSDKINAKVGVQRVSASEKGAFTGQISALMAKNVGVNYVLIGHAEARGFSNLKGEIEQCLKNGLIPVVCIGFVDKKDTGDVFENVKKEVLDLSEYILGLGFLDKIVYWAYEPSWLIGSGTALSKEDVKNTAQQIKDILPKENNMVLYGGGVNPDNFSDLMNVSSVDGFLIGGASINVAALTKLLEIYKN